MSKENREMIVYWVKLIPWIVIVPFILPIYLLGFLTALIVKPFIGGFNLFEMVFIKSVSRSIGVSKE